jgi:hypothetical protein
VLIPRKESNAMKPSTIKTNAMPNAPVGKAWDEVSASFDRFCLATGIETLDAMMEADAEAACGSRHSRSADRLGHRWAHDGQDRLPCRKVAMERPRVRGLDGKELPLPSWEQAVEENWLGRLGDEPDADQRVDAQVSACGRAETAGQACLAA